VTVFLRWRGMPIMPPCSPGHKICQNDDRLPTSMHMRHFWQDVTILGFWHAEIALQWDLDISIDTFPSLTWYTCDYTTHCTLGNKAKEYTSVCFKAHGLSRATRCQGFFIIINHLFIFSLSSSLSSSSSSSIRPNLFLNVGEVI
jgi:hypothetical protein